MADRRMFSKSIINSDAFGAMSAKAQMLYIHLSMSADDEGFLNNAEMVRRTYECSKQDLQELYNRRFLLDLGDGITVIKHWRMNNYIPKDRIKPTQYRDKYELLEIKENGAYTERKNALDTDCIQNVYSLDTDCIQNVGSLYTQVSIGKDRLGKNNKNIGASDDAPTTTMNATKRFVKPSVEEIEGYCKEAGYEISAQHFFDYYEANGWRVGKNPMKDWKATVRNWARNGKRWPKGTNTVFSGDEMTVGPQDLGKLRKVMFGK